MTPCPCKIETMILICDPSLHHPSEEKTFLAAQSITTHNSLVPSFSLITLFFFVCLTLILRFLLQILGVLTSDSTCQLFSYSVNGRWSGWTSWSPCSVTCGNGRQERLRKCDSPVPEYGGKFCDGPAREFHNCEEDDCPGNWRSTVSVLFLRFTYASFSKLNSHIHKEVEPNTSNIKFYDRLLWRISEMVCLNLQVFGASGLHGAHAQRPVVLVEGVTEHVRVKVELRAWDPRARLKSAKCRIVQV